MIDLIRVISTAWSTSKFVLKTVLRGVGVEGQDDQAEPIDNAEMWWPLGFISRPLVPSSGNKLTALVYRDGDDVHVLAVRDKTLMALSDSAVAAGDTVLWSHGAGFASSIRMKANGDITITGATGQQIQMTANGATIQIATDGTINVTPAGGKNVVLAGGSLSAARTSDAVQVTIPTNALTLAVSGSSATGPAVPLTLNGTITGAGAAQVKA